MNLKSPIKQQISRYSYKSEDYLRKEFNCDSIDKVIEEYHRPSDIAFEIELDNLEKEFIKKRAKDREG